MFLTFAYFVSKAWIDVFGARSAKAIGSFVTHFSHGDVTKLRALSEIPSILITLFFIILVWLIGKDFESLNTSGHIIGADLDEDAQDYESDGTNVSGDFGLEFSSRKMINSNTGTGAVSNVTITGKVLTVEEFNSRLFSGVFEDEKN